MSKKQQRYDAIVVGAGVSGSNIANQLSQAGWKCLVLEAGQYFSRDTYLRHEMDSNAQLFWNGGLELNSSASLALLRPKVVGGGSIVNQALLDEFDEAALSSWRDQSGIQEFSQGHLRPWYDAAKAAIRIQEVDPRYANPNAQIFREGFQACGYQCAPLQRGQADCRFEDGNDCIQCLGGCRIDSKQSTPVTTLRQALQAGCQLLPEFETLQVAENRDGVQVLGRYKTGQYHQFSARKLVLAAGAVGNSKLLLKSGFARTLPSLGQHFYSHPQFMYVGLYDRDIDAHRGPLQSYKSNDPSFRQQGFKLENVFAPPAAMGLLMPGYGLRHQRLMRRIRQMACIEVAVRDSHPGRIRLDNRGQLRIDKELNAEDSRRKQAGVEAVYNIFNATGARRIIPGRVGIGLHLMGGLCMGVDGESSCIDPDFKLHGQRHMIAADSSAFPNAPGINPSLTIMALARKAAARLLQEA